MKVKRDKFASNFHVKQRLSIDSAEVRRLIEDSDVNEMMPTASTIKDIANRE